MTYFINCISCGHEKSAFLVFRAAGLLKPQTTPSRSEIEVLLPRLRCESCQSKNFQVREILNEEKLHYWATSESENKVFHRGNCRWMQFVPAHSEINFGSRDAALKRGYKSCAACQA